MVPSRRLLERGSGQRITERGLAGGKWSQAGAASNAASTAVVHALRGRRPQSLTSSSYYATPAIHLLACVARPKICQQASRGRSCPADATAMPRRKPWERPLLPCLFEGDAAGRSALRTQEVEPYRCWDESAGFSEIVRDRSRARHRIRSLLQAACSTPSRRPLAGQCSRGWFLRQDTIEGLAPCLVTFLASAGHGP